MLYLFIDGHLLSGGMEELLLWDKNATDAAEPKRTLSCANRGIIKEIVSHPTNSKTFATCSDRLGSSKPSICVWDLDKKDPVLVIEKFPSKVFCIAYGELPNGKMGIFSTHEDGSVVCWDAETGERLYIFNFQISNTHRSLQFRS